jgi:hypothetical protein
MVKKTLAIKDKAGFERFAIERGIYHRDTKNTEVTQRGLHNSLRFPPLCGESALLITSLLTFASPKEQATRKQNQ